MGGDPANRVDPRGLAVIRLDEGDLGVTDLGVTEVTLSERPPLDSDPLIMPTISLDLSEPLQPEFSGSGTEDVDVLSDDQAPSTASELAVPEAEDLVASPDDQFDLRVAPEGPGVKITFNPCDLWDTANSYMRITAAGTAVIAGVLGFVPHPVAQGVAKGAGAIAAGLGFGSVISDELYKRRCQYTVGSNLQLDVTMLLWVEFH